MQRQLTLGFVPYGTGTHEPFDAVYPKAKNVTVSMIDNGAVDALVIWGGQDISPSLYGEAPNRFTHAGHELSYRDKVEVGVVQAAINCSIPIIGVCRGAQLLCAAAGGKLIQHVEGHHGNHYIVTDDGREIVTSSVHHQMLYPWDVEHKLIAWSKHRLSPEYFGEGERSINGAHEHPEPEIVYFPAIKALAIQGHPEFMGKDSPFVKYCNELVQQYLLVKSDKPAEVA